MKKQLMVALFTLSAGVSLYTGCDSNYKNNYMQRNTQPQHMQYKKVDMLEDAIKKHADNIEDAIESFTQKNNLDKKQYRLVSKWEKAVIKHADNVEDMIEKSRDKYCPKLSDKVDKELQLLDRTSGYFIKNAHKFLEMYSDAAALNKKVNFEIEQLNTAIADFNKVVNVFVQQHMKQHNMQQ